jgi:uncharacterized protein (UPF0333 family)
MKGQASIGRTPFTARHLRGQASMELLITLGIILAFTLPVIFLMFTVTQVGYEETEMAQADASARSLADTINLVYSQGPDAKRTIVLNNPPSTESVTMGSGEVVVRIKTSEGYYDGVSPTFAKIAGEETEPQTIGGAGLFVVEVYNSDGEVVVGVPTE